MNFVKYYFIGVLIAIAALMASTFWQYQQFQNNIKNLSSNLPPQISSGIPDFNSQFAQMMKQAQGQIKTQNGGQAQVQNKAAEPVETKKYTAPDNSFSFDYPVDWQEVTDQQIDDVDGKIIFYATKIDNAGIMPTTNILTVKESNAKTSQEIIDKLKEEAKSKGTAVKFAQSEIINGIQSFPFVEMEYDVNDPLFGQSASFFAKNAILTINKKNVLITTFIQDPVENKILENLFKTIIISSTN